MGKRNKNRVPDWRTAAQKQELWKLFDPLGTVLNILGAASLAMVLWKGGIWIAGAAVMTVISWGLYLAFPQYFSILDSKTYKKTGSKAKVKEIISGLLCPMIGLVSGHFELMLTILDWRLMLGEVLILSFLLMVVLCICSREVRETGEALLTAVFFVAVFSFGLLEQGNHYLNRDPQLPESYAIVEKDSYRRRRHYNYVFIIETAPGETLRLDVPADLYRSLEPGESVPVCIHTGAFGIQYAYIPEAE